MNKMLLSLETRTAKKRTNKSVFGKIRFGHTKYSHSIFRTLTFIVMNNISVSKNSYPFWD